MFMILIYYIFLLRVTHIAILLALTWHLTEFVKFLTKFDSNERIVN
jgi:hypothetical protein